MITVNTNMLQTNPWWTNERKDWKPSAVCVFLCR